MTSEDDEFERALSLYSEIETLPKEQAPQPRTIRQYHQRIQLNNSTSIFDLDYTLDAPANKNARSGCYAELDKSFDEDVGVFKDEKVTFAISGRGRGGRNIYINPGEPNLNKGLNGKDDVRQQIRRVAPIGYGNEITESSVRAHQMSRVLEQDTISNPSILAVSKVSPEAANTSPGKTKTKSTANNESPSLSGKSTPCTSTSSTKSKTKSITNTHSPNLSGKSTPCTSTSSAKSKIKSITNTHSPNLSGKSTPWTNISPAKSKTKSIPNTDSHSLSGKSTPCSTASDIQSSDYYTSQDHNGSSGSSKSNRNVEVLEDESDKSKDEYSDGSSASTSGTRPKSKVNAVVNGSSGSSKSHRNEEEEDDESEESEDDHSEGSLASTSGTQPKAEVNTGAISKTSLPPLSVMLKQSREEHKKKQLYRQAGLITDYSKVNDENDLASRRTIHAILRQDILEQEMRKKKRLSKSSDSSLSSRDNVLPWRRRNNSPPRFSWGQADWRREPKQLDINSVEDFPALN